MITGHRLRFYPTPAQISILLQWIGCQRFIYNAKVSEDRYFRRFARQSLSHAGQFAPVDQKYAQFKTELTPWLSDVPSVILRNGAALWMNAYSRFFKKLAGRPTFQRKSGVQSVWITSELLSFSEVKDESGEVISHHIDLGTKRFPVGRLSFVSQKPFKTPASLHIKVDAGRWFISFCSEDGQAEPSEEDTLNWLMQFKERELLGQTLGIDRGVSIPLAMSDFSRVELLTVHQQRIRQQERYKARWQRKQSRRTEGSKNWRKAVRRVARAQVYAREVRRDVAHQCTHQMASDERYKLYVFEALKVQNMTRAPKAKQDDQGRWMRNGAKAKAGLNTSILRSMWGQSMLYLKYKTRRAGKLCIEVPAHYSSQECAACGHVHSDNRISQSEFVCQRCGHADNADHNAAKVIAQRGVRLVLSGALLQRKKKKTCAIKRKKVGAECSEPNPEMGSTPDEITVSQACGNTDLHRSLTQETPAIAPA